MSEPRVAWQLKFAALAVIWGSSYLLMEVALGAMSGVQVATVRVIFGGATLLLIMALTRTRLPRGLRVWGHLAVTGLLLCTLPWTLFAVGQERVDSVIAGIANATTPIATVLCSMVLLRHEPIGRRRLGGVAIGFVGVLLILQPWSLAHGPDPVGFAMVLAASASYGVGWTWVRRFLRGVDAGGLSLPVAQVLVATAQMPLVCLAWWRWGSGRELVAPWTLHSDDLLVPLLAVAALGIVGSALAQVMQYDVVRAAGPTVATSVTYLIPVVSVLLGVLVLGEVLGPWALAGAAVVLGASVLIGRSSPRAGAASSRRRRHGPRTPAAPAAPRAST